MLVDHLQWDFHHFLLAGREKCPQAFQLCVRYRLARFCTRCRISGTTSSSSSSSFLYLQTWHKLSYSLAQFQVSCISTGVIAPHSLAISRFYHLVCFGLFLFSIPLMWECSSPKLPQSPNNSLQTMSKATCTLISFKPFYHGKQKNIHTYISLLWVWFKFPNPRWKSKFSVSKPMNLSHILLKQTSRPNVPEERSWKLFRSSSLLPLQGPLLHANCVQNSLGSSVLSFSLFYSLSLALSPSQ